MSGQTFSFSAEVREILDLVIHSLYSDREVFLRELLSNAQDATEKLRFLSLSQPELLENDQELGAKIILDAEGKTLTVSDNGIGMTREEVISHLGTIANSGTRAFASQLKESSGGNLIGQFGVGFYSVFMVADKVIVTTRKAGADANAGIRFECAATAEYTIEETSAPRGTSITLNLKEDALEFGDAFRLEMMVKKHSENMALPTYLVESGKERLINLERAFWQKNKRELTEADYQGFYKTQFHDMDNPLDWIHAHVEGSQDYTLLLYIPAKNKGQLWERDFQHQVKLYVKRVFILEGSEKLLPRYLRFVKGMIDAKDLALNVSREMLQGSKALDAIRQGAVKKILSQLEDMAANKAEQFQQFQQQFGMVLKEGMGEDLSQRERIAKLLRFSSSKTNDDSLSRSLDDYIAAMPEGQTDIYYLTAENHKAARKSPQAEKLLQQGYEVLYMTHPIDEWWVHFLPSYQDKRLVHAGRGELPKSEAAPLTPEADQAAPAALLEKIQSALLGQIKFVRSSQRLVHSPVCIVADDNDPGALMSQMLRASGQEVPVSLPILEINAQHSLIQKLAATEDTTQFSTLAQFLLDAAKLSEGVHLEDTLGFLERAYQLIDHSLPEASRILRV